MRSRISANDHIGHLLLGSCRPWRGAKSDTHTIEHEGGSRAGAQQLFVGDPFETGSPNHSRKGARMFAICRAISLSSGTQSSFPHIIIRTM